MRSLSPNIPCGNLFEKTLRRAFLIFQNIRHCSFGIISTYPKQYSLYTIYSDSFAYPLTEVGSREDNLNVLNQI